MSPSKKAPKRWTAAIQYPLQPAPHFEGRIELRAELARWAVAAEDPDRVVALVAVGGTGKTALAERVVHGLKGYTAAGVFVWSFYEEPKTEAFLKRACEYFLGEAPKETGGLLERFQAGMRTDGLPHLLILDGLELIQADGSTGRLRGEFDRDPLMKRFLRWLATGHGTCAKALITTRFPLPDLADWVGHGFRPIMLDDLDPPAARAVLRKWGVKGSGGALDALAGSVHHHALTVDVLGSYLGTFHDGNAAKAPSFDSEVLVDTDQKTARLHRVLTDYSRMLNDRERDLLARLSKFPRGVGVEVIDSLVDAGGAVAGTLVSCQPPEVLKLLERLRALGLVFRYNAGGQTKFTAHPFLRGFFALLITNPKAIHEAVRARLAAGLDERPDSYKEPVEPAELDYYEELVEQSVLSGHDSFLLSIPLFYHRLGHLLGDYLRGLRVVRIVAGVDVPSAIVNEQHGALATQWGLFAASLGDLGSAREAFEVHNRLCGAGGAKPCASGYRNLVHVECCAGRFPRALQHAKILDSDAVTSIGSNNAVTQSYLAILYNRLGDRKKARSKLLKIDKHSNEVNSVFGLAGQSLVAVAYALCSNTRDIDIRRMLSEFRKNNQNCEAAILETVAGHQYTDWSSSRARNLLKAARGYASKTGHAEVTVRCYHLAAALARHHKDLGLAASEAIDGVLFADSTGFGAWSLDIRVELAQIHLVAGEPAKAIEPAEWVLRRSLEEDCQYVWGQADARHLLGVAYSRIRGRGNKAKARKYLRQAVEQRKQLKHSSLADTRAELARIGG